MASKRIPLHLAQALQPARLIAAPIATRYPSLHSIHTRTVISRTQQPFRRGRSFSSTLKTLKYDPSTSKIYDFKDISSLSSNPSQNLILIDVREPSELQSTGTIPTSKNIPIKSSPDSFFLSPEEFEDKYGFARPSGDDEVVFFCKSGVRSKAAAQLARQSGFGGKVGEYPGSWTDWAEKGGEAEKVR